jgi:NADH dehydrogenase
MDLDNPRGAFVAAATPAPKPAAAPVAGTPADAAKSDTAKNGTAKNDTKEAVPADSK